jgi:Fe-S-cluster containining protein
MAAHLQMSETDFRERFARRLDRGESNSSDDSGWSLNETKTRHGYDCVFLDRTSKPGKAVCGIYAARPMQCRTWPFWPENLKSPRHWSEVKRRTPCPGMGPPTPMAGANEMVPLVQIRIQLSRQCEAE